MIRTRLEFNENILLREHKEKREKIKNDRESRIHVLKKKEIQFMNQIKSDYIGERDEKKKQIVR